MYLFYAPDIAVSPILPEEESQHCVRVLRTSCGGHIYITDGQGSIYEAEITNPHRKHCEVKIVGVEQPAPLHKGYIHIAIAPTKNIDRLEWMVEKCTEMGVDEITPLLCRFSERKTVNNDRLQRIMVSAAKQSLKATFPRINPLTPYADLIRTTQAQDKLIAHCIDGYDASDSKSALQHSIVQGHSVLVLIGPEGDFSQEEVQMALDNGFRAVSLGKARLRTETAGLVACHTAILINS